MYELVLVLIHLTIWNGPLKLTKEHKKLWAYPGQLPLSPWSEAGPKFIFGLYIYIWSSQPNLYCNPVHELILTYFYYQDSNTTKSTGREERWERKRHHCMIFVLFQQFTV